MTEISVSVVIPAYNVEACIRRAIDSVLRQTVPVKEILVVDDGSTDSTCNIVRQFGAPVRLLCQPHAGAAGARNTGIQASQGDLVAFLDADDEWRESKLEKQLNLHRQDKLALSFCRSDEIDPGGRNLGDTFREVSPLRGAGAWRRLLAVNFIATPTVMAGRADLLALGGFNSALKVGEDQDLWIRLALLGRVDFVDESLVLVHVRPEGLSNSGFKDQVDYTLQMILRHLEALKTALSESEVNSIRATRFGRVGRNAYAHGEYRIALPLIANAVRLGDGMLRNIYHLAAFAPVLRRLMASLQWATSRTDRSRAVPPAGQGTQ